MTFSPLRTEQAHALGERVVEFGKAQKHEVLEDLGTRLGSLDATERDRLSTALMGVYHDTRASEAFSLLFELNQKGVLRLVYHHLRRSFFSVDANDVLQEVFFNIYRYPDRFDPSKPAAFRNWTHSIVRNTALKYSRRAQRNHVVSLGGGANGDREDDIGLFDPADENAHTPLEEAQQHEADHELVGAWLLYLHFYLDAYARLTPAEKRALFLVEVKGLPYKEAAAKLDLRVENLKMRIFRARRKVFTIMQRRFAGDEKARAAASAVHAALANGLAPDPARVARGVGQIRTTRVIREGLNQVLAARRTPEGKQIKEAGA
ncbi:MAG: RNA polymerase sigma factor [Planctomycetota bacterium]|nr:RNA polymerase sigma factor [Planctomycetota bacterium]